jgi:hypothetical protein
MVTFHHDEKLAQAGGKGGGVHANPLSLYLLLRTKLWCMLQLRGQIYTPPISSLPLYVLCSYADNKEYPDSAGLP